MRVYRIIGVLLFICVLLGACKKDKKLDKCAQDLETLRTIDNKRAVVRLSSGTESVFLVEENAIDSYLIPCNLARGYYEEGLQVRISGVVKVSPQMQGVPCCREILIISSITKE